MFCPQCSAESDPTQKFCRKCGANLGLIFKAVKVTEAIARGDRHGLLDLKASLEGDRSHRPLGAEIAQGIGQITTEIQRALAAKRHHRGRSKSGAASSPDRCRSRAPFTPEGRRENSLSAGVKAFFSGIGVSIFLYFLMNAIIVAGQVGPQDEPIIRVVWIAGLIPSFVGIGLILSGLITRRGAGSHRSAANMTGEVPVSSQDLSPDVPAKSPVSVTESTTELLRDAAGSPVNPARHLEKE